jgi:hypothetical protein
LEERRGRRRGRRREEDEKRTDGGVSYRLAPERGA